MSTDSKSHSSVLSHLRHELRTPINAIVGYSEMIIEEIAEIGLEVEYLAELEEIRSYGAELLSLIDTYLNPAISPSNQLDLATIINNPAIKIELAKPTKLVIHNCQQLINSIEQDFVKDLEKINHAANKLLR